MNSKIHLICNIILLPIKDLDFFNLSPIVDTIEGLNSKRSTTRPQRELLEMIYQNLTLKCKVNSFDEINLLMEKYYPFLFHSGTEHEFTENHSIKPHFIKYYFDILKRLSKSLLSIRDGEIVFKHWKTSSDEFLFGPIDEADKVQIFSIVSRLIPLDVLISIFLSANEINDTLQLDGFYQHINISDAPLDDVLESGVSDNHIHASSAFNFTFLWEMIMNNRIKGEYTKNFYKSIYASKIEPEKYFAVAQLYRLLISIYVKKVSDIDYPTDIISFNEWILEEFHMDSDSGEKICDVINHMVCEKDIFNFNVSKINNLIETIKLILAINNSEDNKDIIYQIFDSHSHIKTYSENIFNMHILNTLAKFENSNLVLYENLAEIYLKYVCIKSEFYKEVTQSDTIKGLDFFRLYFSRAVYGFKKDHFYYTTMFRTLFQNKYLKKVELRFSLNRNIDEDRKQIKDILTAYHDVLKEDFDLHSEEVSFPRIGIVYHLIKMPDSIEKCITSERHGDKYYFGSAQEKYLNQVNQMLELRNKIPHLSRFIVGIDAASAENNTPVQVFAPVFNIARDSHGEKLLKVDKKAKIIRKQSLFFTFHAGEDFRHLLSGLRRIDEVIDFCKLHSGDRIGHAIALGISVDTWVKENPIVAIPRGEYLDNLIWVWGVYSNLSNIRSKAFIFLEQRILKLVKEVYSFSENVAIQTLYSAYLKRFEKVSHFDCDIICEEGKCSIKNINNVINSDIIKASYNCKICLEKIKEPIYINPCDLEYEIIKEMQDYLQEKVARKGIVIEINPTSNAAIGSMKSIFDNQLYSLNYIGDDAKKNIMICINSDNPLVFNTNVSNEIGYLYYGMLKKGVGRESALLWIEKLRKTGMDTSFIKLNTSNKEYLYALETVIEELDNSAHI